MPPPPTTPQSNTLFNYFNRTPKSGQKLPSSSPSNGGETPNEESRKNGSKVESPTAAQNSPALTTPVQSKQSKKKRIAESQPGSASEDTSSRKKPRVEESSRKLETFSIIIIPKELLFVIECGFGRLNYFFVLV